MRIGKNKEIIIYVIVEIGKKLIELWENHKTRRNQNDGERAGQEK